MDGADYDVVIIGSGAGGMAAGIAAALRGLKAVVIEKTEYYGGTTAVSGGIAWIPANHYMREQGVDDSRAEAKRYLREIVGEEVPALRRDTYVETAPEMIEAFHNASPWLRWVCLYGYPDYRPEEPGGTTRGRGLEPQTLDGRKLGNLRAQLRPSGRDLIGTLLTFDDVGNLVRTYSWKGIYTALTVLGRLLRTKLFGFDYLMWGQALVGRLRLALSDHGVPVVLSTAFVDLVAKRDAQGEHVVTGVVLEQDGGQFTVNARKGVVLAAGGFSRSQSLRDRYHPSPSRVEWTLAPEGATGDTIKPALKLGAALGFMDHCWGTPGFLIPGPDGIAELQSSQLERPLPGTLVVDQAGKRFMNEAASYNTTFDEMYANNRGDGNAIPSWFIFDQRAKNRYLMLGTLPRTNFPEEWYEGEFVLKAGSLAELAAKTAIPEENLRATIQRFNRMAAEGKDSEFSRGESRYDMHFGDPRFSNPNLQAVDKAPFYAVPLYPGDIGTRGGLLADHNACVLDENNCPIRGLYATGNNSASAMGRAYAGPGATIGPAMVFGYIAANHAATRENWIR